GDELSGADVEGDVAKRGHVHLVAAAELARDGVEAKTNGLAEQVPENIGVRGWRRRRRRPGDHRLGDCYGARRALGGGARRAVAGGLDGRFGFSRGAVRTVVGGLDGRFGVTGGPRVRPRAATAAF